MKYVNNFVHGLLNRFYYLEVHALSNSCLTFQGFRSIFFDLILKQLTIIVTPGLIKNLTVGSQKCHEASYFNPKI